MSAIYFRDPEELTAFLKESVGAERFRLFQERRIRSIPASFVFYPSVNEFHGEKSVQIVIENYCNAEENVI